MGTQRKSKRQKDTKKVMDTLKGKSMKWSELKAKLKISERALSRVLDDLEFWGLAKKQEGSRFGRWSWYEPVKTYETREDYEIALKHSEDLFLGLHEILDEERALCLQLPHPLTNFSVEKYETEGSVLKVFAEEHLKTAYPEIHKKLIEFREVLTELQKLKDHHNAKEVFQHTKRYWEDYPYERPNPRFRRPQEHIPKAVKRLREQRLESFKELASHFLAIKLKVKMGEPLRGSCQVCPRVHIIKGKK